MATLAYPPHPLLKEPVLYIADPPDHVEWAQLKPMFDCCGEVDTDGKSWVYNTPGQFPTHATYSVRFESLFEAEMALATLQSQPVDGVSPPWCMILSHSPTLDSALPTGSRWAQRVIKTAWSGDLKPGATAQSVFKWFRSVGPLVSARTNMYMGSSEFATVIEYWDIAHSDIAGLSLNQVHKELHHVPKFDLVGFDPCSLRCSQYVPRCVNWDDEEEDAETRAGRFAVARELLMTKLASFGKITSTNSTEEEDYFSDVVTFESSHSAAQALVEMDSLDKRYDRILEYNTFVDPPCDSPRQSEPETAPSEPSYEPRPETPTIDNTMRTRAMATKSHPLLEEPILYIVNPPDHIKWGPLRTVFTKRGCGNVYNLGWSAVDDSFVPSSWAVQFEDLFHAELALATMQESVIQDAVSPWIMVLSHCPTLESAIPSALMYSQYIQADPAFFSSEVTTQLLFRYFRTAGPLVSVRMNVEIGGGKRTATVEYWNELHANEARNARNALHKKMRNRPAFSMRTYDPRSLRCSGFKPSCQLKDLTDAFSEFGSIIGARTESEGDMSYVVLTFSSAACAAHALQGMDGKAFEGARLTVRYFEPDAQDEFFGPPASTFSSSDWNSWGNPSTTSDDPLASSPSPEQRQRDTNATSASSAEETRAKTRQEHQARRIEAERVNAKAKRDLETAKAERQSAHTEVGNTTHAEELADQELAEAKQACAEAERLWLAARERAAAATQNANTAHEARNNALLRKDQADARVKVFEKEELSSRIAKEKLAKEANEYDVYDEEAHQAELAESIRRMQELRKLEQKEKEEKVRRERQAAEERGRREREEADRFARQKREQEEKLRREAETRRRLYAQAVAKEQNRCRLRDLKFCPDNDMWYTRSALERFKFVSNEFDTLKFQESQPLTFESIPWPILAAPCDMILDEIDWSAVERFFEAMENRLQDRAEYRVLVEKAHRRFHPDKWRARGILNSVLDDDLRSQLEVAGNVVAQAITPLWLKARG